MSKLQHRLKLFLGVLSSLILVLFYQNCSPAFEASMAEMSSFDSDSNLGQTSLLGKNLYSQKCASCHGVFEISTLRGRVITSAKISNAFSTISSMKPMKGLFSDVQIDSIVQLFSAPHGPTAATSSFICSSPEEEKNNSSDIIRLTGPELKATYKALLSSGVWSSLSDFYYLLPTDNFDGSISNFANSYSEDQVGQISRFNEKIALAITSTASNLTSFFGNCATTTAFSQTCFNSFLASKGPLIFRSTLESDDASRIWSLATQATEVSDRQKIVIQLLFNDLRFLYHVEQGEGTPSASGLVTLSAYEIANRIAYGMTSAPPDTMLWADAVNGNLKQLANVIGHVDRIAQTSAFKSRVIDFAKFYTGQSNAPLAPTLASFTSGLNVTNLNVDSETEFDEYINYVVFGKRGTLMDLFSSKAAFPKSTSLASVLGTAIWTTGAPLSAPNHAGILARPYLNLNPSANGKYVQRGRRIRLNMLCSDVPQPSAADLAARPILSEQDLVNLTRRQYVDKATMGNVPGTACFACHSKMNQIGFATSNYDSAGRFITVEKIFNSSNVLVAQNPVDASSLANITEVDSRVFSNINDFQVAMAESDALQQCFSRKTLQFFTRRADDISFDSCRLNKIDNFIKSGTPLVDVFTSTFKNTSVLYKRSN